MRQDRRPLRNPRRSDHQIKAGGGVPVSLEALTYSEVFSLRWGVYCLKMLARSSTSDRPLERLMIARRVSETEIDLLRFIAPRDT